MGRDRRREVLRVYRDFIRDAPDELGTVVRFAAAPPLPVIPEDLHWRPVVMVGTCCYAGPIAGSAVTAAA